MNIPVSFILRSALEIGLLWLFYFGLLRFFQGTIAVRVLRGILILFLLFFLTQVLHLEVLNWLFAKVLAISVVAILILFQPELRGGLAKIGGEYLFRSVPHKEQVMDEVVQAVTAMARKKMGAIIAIERQTALRSYAESGIGLDSEVSSELLMTLFTPPGPLHDGGVIIADGRVIAAGCLYPLTQDSRVLKSLGTRHRAALGLSEETDALIIVVSEETGGVSLAVRGELSQDLDRDALSKSLKELYGQRGILMPESAQSKAEEKDVETKTSE